MENKDPLTLAHVGFVTFLKISHIRSGSLDDQYEERPIFQSTYMCPLLLNKYG